VLTEATAEMAKLCALGAARRAFDADEVFDGRPTRTP
jgi:hypothetical protein